MRKAFGFLAAAAVSFSLMSAGNASAETTLRAVSFISKNHPLLDQAQVWVNEVNAALKGKLKVNYVGGPEVIPAFQQAGAVGKGIVDIAFNPTAFYQSTFPEAAAFVLSRKSVTEERAPGGFYDYMVRQHERLNLHYVGRVLWSPFYFWTSTPVESLAALEGRKLRTSALYDRFMKAVNVVPVTIPEGDTYTALEGGTVDGFGWPLAGPRERGWTKISRYVIDLPFFESQNLVIIMNLDKWKALPADVRETIDRVTAEFEPKMVEHFRKAEAAEWAELEKVGVTRTKFRNEADNRRFIDTAYEIEWKNLETKIPDRVAELRRLTGN